MSMKRIARYSVNNIKPAPKFNPHGRHGNNHFCTMEAWAGFGGRISLNNLADILGEGSKSNSVEEAIEEPASTKLQIGLYRLSQ